VRPTEVTDAEVVQAGEALIAANRNVTGFALRKALGGGSAPRLRQVWDDHLNSQSLSKVEPVAELPNEVASELRELTDGLVQRLQNMAVGLNDKAVKASEKRVSELVKSVGAQRAQAERELADASTAVDELESQLGAAAQEKAQLLAKLDASNTTIQQQAVELAQLTERLAAAERATNTAQERLVAAETGARVAAEQVAKEAEKTVKAREDAARAAGQVDSLERQVKELMTKVGVVPAAR